MPERRVLSQDSLEGESGLEDFSRDADGSAKVALIAMDRSIAAWSGMLEYAPEGKADIVGFIHELERLRRTAEWAFPGARTFIRPGLDDV